jgi:hypothetical protein
MPSGVHQQRLPWQQGFVWALMHAQSTPVLTHLLRGWNEGLERRRWLQQQLLRVRH